MTMRAGADPLDILGKADGEIFLSNFGLLTWYIEQEDKNWREQSKTTTASRNQTKS